MDAYFEKFPKITYNGVDCIDITRNAVMRNSILQNPYVFYNYDISSGEREDQFSARYYEDPYKAWIVFHSNKILDPYYEWYMSSEQFESFIEMKYGSIRLSQEKISYYKNAWENAEDLDISGFDSLPSDRKKYWEPRIGNYNKIISYKRKEEDWEASTNKLIRYSVNSPVKFDLNELCNIGNSGRGQVAFSNTSILVLKHLSGNYANNSAIISSMESSKTANVIEISSIEDSINPVELAYWRPVTVYEDEYNKNEYNKSIRVIDKDYSEQISEDLSKYMKE